MIEFDKMLDVAIGRSSNSKSWKNTRMPWSDFVERLKKTIFTNETHKEFMASNKNDQKTIKDVGAYVGAYLRGGKRGMANVVHRQLITLDIDDFAHSEVWEDLKMQLNNAAVLHGTHKWTKDSPRYRLVMPLSREVTQDEYSAISRKIASFIGIEIFDNTGFDSNRLMYWPSTPRDTEYYFKMQDGPFVDADEILESYIDWKDSSSWPTSKAISEKIYSESKTQEDPNEKKGIIGAFCRTFPIEDAIETFLGDTYSYVSDDRYTYANGSTACGLVTYEGKFAYSHHSTDPCSGKLCNSFDLVRIHNFGHLDLDINYVSKSPSFSAMEKLALANDKVRDTIALETVSKSQYEFDDGYIEEVQEESIETEWMRSLEVDQKGNFISSATNLNIIFSKDPRLKGLFKQNDFDGKRYVFGSMPWRKIKKPEPVKNVDYSGVRNYIESFYRIASSLKIEDSMALEFERNHFHPIREFLESLKWDGKKRIDHLLINFFGAEDNQYSREAIRKTLVGAVSRIFKPGCKFDLVLTLVSQQQGTGKSSFFASLGGEWFSDTFMTVQGKEALEQIQGSWLIEMAELSGLRKADVEATKHFISKQIDTFRPAYGRVSETYPRQCVFVATTNKYDFLKDPSGNRRFMPVKVQETKITENPKLMSLLKDSKEINQIWAEAKTLFDLGETLYLSVLAEEIAQGKRIEHCEVDERLGLVEEYLNTLLPDNWEKLDEIERRMFLQQSSNERSGKPRRKVCVAEIWVECLGKAKQDMSRYNTKEINDLMRGLENWEQSGKTKNFKIYGKQKYYIRIK